MNRTEGCLFLDRDGVMNHLVKYGESYDSPQKPEDVELVVGIVDLVQWANEQGIEVVEVSNQPGVAKGKQTPKLCADIDKQVHDLIRQGGARIDHTYICLHHPKGIVPELTIECDCRKPKPGLFFQAQKELGIDLSSSIMLGDKASDAAAGYAAGCTTIIFLHQEDVPEKVAEAYACKADYKVTSLAEALEILKTLFGKA